MPDNVVNSGMMRWVETMEGRDCVLAYPQESVECQAEGSSKHGGRVKSTGGDGGGGK